ncbi:MAG: alpha/beta-hydrolase family protein [Rhodococcus sp. (in: high G+C Gram-positive bacteria)]|uniref:alpha/beta-hydrolase family protein n=1 Tax=Rhodococcus sp. TaxID=1831 RepID=UPI002AD8DA6E|nr:alpha/beta-hydrolase family protein [Rhodococcus sp. (in: high G+C Gram-positive bacteria)]
MSVLNASRTPALARVGALALPRVSTSVAVAAMSAISLAPGLLPRSAVLQGVFSGLLVAAGLLAMWAFSAVARRLVSDRVKARFDEHHWRISALGLSTAAAAIAVFAASSWQNSLRAAMGAPSAGLLHWAEAGCIAALTALGLWGIGVGISKALRWMGFARSVAALVMGVLGVQLVVGPAVWNGLSDSFDSSNAYIDTALTQPLSASVSGSPESLISWTSMGAEGRKFVATDPREDSVRVYAGVDSAPNAASRAALAVSELDRVGGFARNSVVVAVPTGSGWIDTHAVDGIEQRFGGDVAIVGQQYSDAPSWATFLFSRDEAEDSATALFTAVGTHIASMPTEERPDLFLYGQSLGAVGGSAALMEKSPTTACDVLWAGPPAGATRTEGATVLANTSDPVVWWSPALATQKPDLSRAVQDAPIPQWIPGVTFLQTTADMLGSLGVPAGHGHRYGTDQGTALGTCS